MFPQSQNDWSCLEEISENKQQKVFFSFSPLKKNYSFHVSDMDDSFHGTWFYKYKVEDLTCSFSKEDSFILSCRNQRGSSLVVMKEELANGEEKLLMEIGKKSSEKKKKETIRLLFHYSSCIKAEWTQGE